MKDIDVEAHESGHALAGYYYNVPIESVSTYSKDGHAGRCRLKPGAVSSELDAATILVAGRMAEKRALGHREAFNWFDDDDHDTAHAVAMVDAIVADGGFQGDLFAARHFVELKAQGLLATKWRAIEALAAALRKTKRLTGDEVIEICRREGVLRQRELTQEQALAKLTPEGKRALLGAVGQHGKNIIKR